MNVGAFAVLIALGRRGEPCETLRRPGRRRLPPADPRHRDDRSSCCRSPASRRRPGSPGKLGALQRRRRTRATSASPSSRVLNSVVSVYYYLGVPRADVHGRGTRDVVVARAAAGAVRDDRRDHDPRAAGRDRAVAAPAVRRRRRSRRCAEARRCAARRAPGPLAASISARRTFRLRQQPAVVAPSTGAASAAPGARACAPDCLRVRCAQRRVVYASGRLGIGVEAPIDSRREQWLRMLAQRDAARRRVARARGRRRAVDGVVLEAAVPRRRSWKHGRREVGRPDRLSSRTVLRARRRRTGMPVRGGDRRRPPPSRGRRGRDVRPVCEDLADGRVGERRDGVEAGVPGELLPGDDEDVAAELVRNTGGGERVGETAARAGSRCRRARRRGSRRAPL